MSVGLDSMTPRELCAGLMRGNRLDMRRGYSAESAALAAANRHDLDPLGRARLLAYARGFADGMRFVIQHEDPRARIAKAENVAEKSKDNDYVEGLSDGMAEDGLGLYPTLHERGESGA